jgi:hypothetical protein
MRPLFAPPLLALPFALFALAVAGASPAWSQQDLLRGSRTIPDNAQQQDLLRFERIERERQQQQQRQQLFDLETQRRQIQNDQLRNAPPYYGVPPGATYAPNFQQPVYPAPVFPAPGYVVPQQQACRAFTPAYDQAGRFLGNICIQ